MIKILVILITIIMVFSGLVLMSNPSVNHNNYNIGNIVNDYKWYNINV